MMAQKPTQLHFVKHLRQVSGHIDRENAVLIYDRILEKKFPAFVKSWSRRYPVRSGEQLKAMENFPKHAQKILALCEGLPTKKITIVSMGGGSVGDFSGFVASVLKRGVSLVHIPSTWLSAVDSAHGGKTALNVGRLKNQYGTFWPAQKTFLVKELLLSQPAARVIDARGEVVKIALINGGSLFSKLNSYNQSLDAELLWKHLRELIVAKLKVVRRDPLETRGVRYILNLGHTLGHVLELQQGLSHGLAVAHGLRWSIAYSQKKAFLKTPNKILSQNLLRLNLPDERNFHQQIKGLRNVGKVLAQDKKMSGRHKLKFVFVSKPGRCTVAEVSIKDLVHSLEQERQQ